MNRNSILLRRLGKIVVPNGDGDLPASHAATINKNLESLGYTLSESVLAALSKLDPTSAALLYEEIVNTLKDLRGVRSFRPMYPNYPRQVMEAHTAELYLNATLHYLSAWVSDVVGGVGRRLVWLPRYRKDEREQLQDSIKLKVIDLGTEDDLRQIFSGMVVSHASISETDKAELKWFVERYGLTLPDSIPDKEILAFVGSLLPEDPKLRQHVKTATDVLRLAVAMSGGDISLAESTKFRNFSRSERRTLLLLLENCNHPVEDMIRWKNRWVRLGERLHPGEHKKRYPNAAEAFRILRDDAPVPTFNSKVERAIRSRDVHTAVDLLRDRAGEFARRLDHLLRLSPGSEDVIGGFGEVAHKVSTPVLLQTGVHFKNRNAEQDLRIFFPKGNLAKVAAISYNLPRIPRDVCDMVVSVCEGVLVERLSKLPALGRVFVDERLKDYLVPFSQRSASRALRTLVRGSKIEFSTKADTIRFFLWWKEGGATDKQIGRVDIDLSAVLYDADWEYKEHVSYTNLRSAHYNACHSGDITSAPNGACEFIDISIPSVLDYGGRYVVMSVNSFTRQRFADLPECRAGWMMREHPNSGEVFDPRTVYDKLDLTSDTTICLPVVLDLAERKAVWADIGLKRNPRHVNNVEGNSSQMSLLGKSLTEIVKPDLYSLFTLHAVARGTPVHRESDADTIFSPEKGITPFDIETIASEYMS